MIGSVTFGPIPPRGSGIFQAQDWVSFTPPKPALPSQPSVAALMKARMLALIDAEQDQSHPSLCRLRDAVEHMEIPE